MTACTVTQILDPATRVSLIMLTPVKSTILGLTPTGEVPAFRMPDQFSPARGLVLQCEIEIPAETAEEALKLAADEAFVTPRRDAARRKAMSEFEAEQRRMMLASAGRMG